MQADVIVCGGGPAGISAALAAAASGAKTVLLEAVGCLGGVWTAGLLGYILDPKPESAVTQLLVSELERVGGEKRWGEFNRFGNWATNSFVYDPEALKWILEQECLKQGITVQLYTRVCSVVKDSARHITSVVTESKSGRQAWSAPVFIDATGDGDLGALAGCSFHVGRPESGEVQPVTLMCLITSPYPDRLLTHSHGSGGPRPLVSMQAAGINPSYGSPLVLRIRNDLFAFMMNHHYASAMNAGELSVATFRARNEVHETIRTLRAAGGTWEGVQVVATASQIGVREGRRLKGLTEVQVQDLIDGRIHDDAVCKATFPIDVHSTRKDSHVPFDPDNKIRSKPYDIPLRALIAADVDNLLMAGRCISGDFLAHSSYRVTGNSIPTGEAVGCLAALASRRGENASVIPFEDVSASMRALNDSLVPQLALV